MRLFHEAGDSFNALLATRMIAWAYDELGEPDRARRLKEDVLEQIRERERVGRNLEVLIQEEQRRRWPESRKESLKARLVAFVEPHTVNSLVSAFRMALPVQNFRGHRTGEVVAPASYVPLRSRIGCDQGTFAAGIPTKESYNRPITPATIAASARLNTYQL